MVALGYPCLRDVPWSSAGRVVMALPCGLLATAKPPKNSTSPLPISPTRIARTASRVYIANWAQPYWHRRACPTDTTCLVPPDLRLTFTRQVPIRRYKH